MASHREYDEVDTVYPTRTDVGHHTNPGFEVHTDVATDLDDYPHELGGKFTELRRGHRIRKSVPDDVQLVRVAPARNQVARFEPSTSLHPQTLIRLCDEFKQILS